LILAEHRHVEDGSGVHVIWSGWSKLEVIVRKSTHWEEASTIETLAASSLKAGIKATQFWPHRTM
jgi:hypothetical protein